MALAIAPVFAHRIEAIHSYDALAYSGAVLVVMAAASLFPWLLRAAPRAPAP